MKLKYGILACVLTFSACSSEKDLVGQPTPSDLTDQHLSSTWDEGMPLGNAVVGSLIWQKGDVLRFSLDRTDLWDLRPSAMRYKKNYRFEWVKEQIRNHTYEQVQKEFDHPYSRLAAPSKIPGAAMEIPVEQWGKTKSVRLYLRDALCEVKWENGVEMQSFVQANSPVGWFVFKNVEGDFEPRLIAPAYEMKADKEKGDSHAGPELQRLGYEQGKVVRNGNTLTYHQKGYKDYAYDVAITWKREGTTVYGTWSVTSTLTKEKALQEAEAALRRGYKKDFADHLGYWKKYWAASSISLPDSVLQRQYDNEMYKFGSASREYSSPISLQAVWTADNGKLPPWKGDYHHDLNTQLSYWPAYAGNHLTEGKAYINTLWNQREVYRKYTRDYFGVEGLNVPGVTSLSGEPMGGWTQYSTSQTVGAWLSQYFYLHWKYSADDEFLKERGYPFLKETATFLENISFVDSVGVRRLEFTTSPEIYDNSPKAWFKDMTNFDLGMMRFLFKATAEMAEALDLKDEAAHWTRLYGQLPDFDTDADGALTFAKGHSYRMSHRHFSHAVAFHPLGLIDWSDGPKAQRIIQATLKKLEEYGPGYWTGYSYSWLGNMYARVFDGNKAAETLKTFAQCFCLKNTFHANGDQTRSGKSYFTYRPFTLEGNFAFAAGIHEMLLQSHTGVVRVFPAIPDDWKDVSFHQLRARGAFLVSAEMKGGKVTHLAVFAEKGGQLDILSPVSGKVERYQLKKGETLTLVD